MSLCHVMKDDSVVGVEPFLQYANYASSMNFGISVNHNKAFIIGPEIPYQCISSIYPRNDSI